MAEELARREAEGLHKFGLAISPNSNVERAIQFEFFEQWAGHCLSMCGAAGIRSWRRCIFVTYDSADVWRIPIYSFWTRTCCRQ